MSDVETIEEDPAVRPARLAFIDDCDDEFFLMDIMMRRAKIDLAVERFTDGLGFLDWLRKRRGSQSDWPDVVVLDLNLPEMDGFEILRAIGEEEWAKPIHRGVCSGSLDPADRQSAMAIGAEFFLSKPFDKTALEEICARCPGLFFRESEQRRRLMIRRIAA